MALISGVVCNSTTNRMFIIDQMFTDNFKLKLDSSVAYKVGIDQSSSCCGLAIKSVDNSYYMLFDIMNNSAHKETFYQEIFSTLYHLLEGQKIVSIVHEHMPPQSYYNGVVLLELEGRVKEWIQSIPALQHAKVGKILPQSWKQFVVNPDLPGAMIKGKKRRRCDVKHLIAWDIVQKYPLLETYYYCTPAKAYDGFDAFGILTGYEKYAYDENGLEKICGIEEKNHESLVAFRPINVSEMQTNDNLIFDIFNGQEGLLNFKYLSYNPQYNLHKNIRLASSNNKAVATVIPDKFGMQAALEFGFHFEPESMAVVAYIFRKGLLTKSEQNVIRKILPYNKSIFGGK